MNELSTLQTELHRHLDVSARHSTLLELAQERGLEAQSTSLEAFKEKIVLREPMTDLATVLRTFTLFQQTLDRPEVLERVAFETIEDCRREGTRQVELRFSPSFVCELSHLSWSACLDGFEAGMQKALQKYPEMKAGLICIASREFGVDKVAETVEFFLKYQERFIGLDLAGPEVEFPNSLFEKSFQRAKGWGARITVHAGEAAGPENIWQAIEDLGAERIGHGVSCVRDPRLMAYLVQNQICLEMCPTSNWITRAVTSLAEHPLPAILRAGIPVCINTDDPSVFGVGLDVEIEITKKHLRLTSDDIKQCAKHADRFSFLNSSKIK